MMHNAPIEEIAVDCGASIGALDWWRHALSHGGINPEPFSPTVVDGVRRLRPRLIRVFLQEFFQIYPDHDTFDWSRLDPFMDSLAATGATVVAAITIKPKPLFPTIDHATWQPYDVEEWQRLIRALVTRYSVERPIVTHWEIGNETDIGEDGGSPYLIPDPADYAAFYRMTVAPILDAFPEAKVGGPAACWIDNEPLPGFVAICREQGIPLNFISWHLYSDDPERHALGVGRARELVAGYPGSTPELFITEWAKAFPQILDENGQATGLPLSVEEMAFESRVAAITADAALAMLDAGVDWAFYYHIQDQPCDPEAFRPFFTEAGTAHMVRHWNEVPHRFGLFGVNGDVRPQYFVFHMLGQLGVEQLYVSTGTPGVRALAGRDNGRHAVMVVNRGDRDRVAEFVLTNLSPGRKRITIARINDDRRWDDETLDLIPVEVRDTFTPSTFRCQAWMPRDSVTLLQLEDLE